MKKSIIINIVITSLILIGCSIANTPTSKIEELLSSYQRLDDNIIINSIALSKEENLNEEIQQKYNNLIKEQYQGLSYEIKEETIDGNTAIVTTSIKVKDYKKIINKYNKNEYTNEEYHNKIIDELKNTKTKVTYTIDFTLTKDKKDNWHIDDLTTEIEKKLLGIN